MGDSLIRSNPPDSVVTFMEHDKYKTLYDDITNNGVLLQYHDRHSLAELAVAMCDMIELRVEIRKNGEWMETQGDRNMIKKKNPARDALAKLQPVVLRLMKEFKMTPSSRGKIAGGIPESGQQNDGFGEI